MKFTWGTLDFNFIIQKTKIVIGNDDPLRGSIERMLARIELALNKPAAVKGDPVQDGPVSRKGCWELMISESGEICILFIEVRFAKKNSRTHNKAGSRRRSPVRTGGERNQPALARMPASFLNHGLME